jgi:tetratricopeptide (TPR) repeat protein
LLAYTPHASHEVGQDTAAIKTVKASREIVVFSDSMEILYKVIKYANTAFYAGELEVAYMILADSLRLFKRLGNKKATEIASNNLGNIMLGMYQEMEKDNLETIGGFTRRQLAVKGIAYFHEAIHEGEKAYEEFYELQGWSPICLDFMQHLANRYFNRGLFLLTVKDDYVKPDELKELGIRDLHIARDMDQEVIAYGEDIGWASDDRVEKMFEITIVRIGGYNLLLELGYPDDWAMEDLLCDAFNIIITEKKRESSALFARMTVAGRIQEIEMELMKYKQVTGDLETAAKIAIRMLQEDESVFVDAQSRAVDILLEYTDSIEIEDERRSRIKCDLQDYQDVLEDCVDVQTQFSFRNNLESDVYARATGNSITPSQRSSSNRRSSAQSFGRVVTMEDF